MNLHISQGLMQTSSIKHKALTSMANSSPILMSSEESCILTVCKPSVGKAVFLPSLASALRLNLAVVHDSVPAMKRKEAIFSGKGGTCVIRHFHRTVRAMRPVEHCLAGTYRELPAFEWRIAPRVCAPLN